MRRKSGNCIGLGSANPKSPDVCKSAALQYGGFYQPLLNHFIDKGCEIIDTDCNRSHFFAISSAPCATEQGS
jgi:hypothetical protein